MNMERVLRVTIHAAYRNNNCYAPEQSPVQEDHPGLGQSIESRSIITPIEV